MAGIQISALSRQYVMIPVTTTVAGSTYNPTGDDVKFAFTTIGAEPQTSDWVAGSWVLNTPTGVYVAQCLVGPGGVITLTIGYWQIWIKITDTPEVPVIQAGSLQITL